jgi:hypothetical protein
MTPSVKIPVVAARLRLAVVFSRFLFRFALLDGVFPGAPAAI